MKTAYMMVVYNKNNIFEWPKLSLGSFREHFKNETLIVVNHNYNEEEFVFLNKMADVVINHPKRRYLTENHGLAIDKVVDWCKKNDIEVLIHFEPDCSINSRIWSDDLIHAIKKGYWMSGSEIYPWGTIHPCPSAWLVSKIKHSFACCKKHDDVYHPKYNSLINSNKLAKWISKNNHPGFYFMNYWDTGIKNWFECAINNKSFLCKNKGDFQHFYSGSTRLPTDFSKNGWERKFMQPNYHYLGIKEDSRKLML